MDRIKRLSFEVLEKYKSKFGESFDENKKTLDKISIIRSKGLKNEIAGFITKYIKKEIRDENAKQARANSEKPSETLQETESDKTTETSTSEDKMISPVESTSNESVS